MKAFSSLIIFVFATITITKGQEEIKSHAYLGFGVSLKTSYQSGDSYNTYAFNPGDFSISLGYIINEGHQLQLDYFIPNYFENEGQWIRYDQIIYWTPPYGFDNEKAFRFTYGRRLILRLMIGDYIFTPKAGITLGFLEPLQQSMKMIQGDFGVGDYTLSSEIIEYNSFHPYFTVGIDLESPKILKKFTVVLSGFYNFEFLTTAKSDVSLVLNGELVYTNTLSTNLNHGNIMTGLRYYFSF